MNVELPPFKNGEHNFESASTINGVITPLRLHYLYRGDPKQCLQLEMKGLLQAGNREKPRH